MNDKELELCIKKFKKTGDNSHFEKIYRFFFKKIYRFVLLNISDSQIAENITSDVFYNVYRNLAKARLNSGSFRAWIYKIARNLIIDYYRKEAKYKEDRSLDQYLETRKYDDLNELEPVDSSLVAGDFKEVNPGEYTGSEFRDPDLLAGLNRLDELQKQVLILRFVEEMDYKTIGRIIDKSELAARAIKFRAISKLKELMAK
jgi:RNA polymerase sigma factor (sigma-70 family)